MAAFSHNQTPPIIHKSILLNRLIIAKKDPCKGRLLQKKDDAKTDHQEERPLQRRSRQRNIIAKTDCRIKKHHKFGL